MEELDGETHGQEDGEEWFRFQHLQEVSTAGVAVTDVARFAGTADVWEEYKCIITGHQ